MPAAAAGMVMSLPQLPPPGVRGSTGSTSSTSSTSSSSSSSSGHRWAGAAKDDAAIMGAASEALVLIRRLRGIRGTDAEWYDAMQRVMETGLAAGGGDVRRPGRPPAARAADATSTGGRSSRKDGRHARGRERRHRVFALVTQGCFGLLAGCTMHALKASDTTTPAAFAEHCIASGFLAFAMRTLRSFAALPSAADTNPLAGMVVAVLQTTVLQEGVADRLLGQHLADHGSTPRELYGLLEGAIERGSEAPVCLQGVRLHTLGRVPGVAAAAAEGAAAASSGAIGGSSASVEAARAVAEEKFRRTGEEQEASATKLSTETWALKVKVLTDSITKLPPGTTSAEAQLQKLLDETPG